MTTEHNSDPNSLRADPPEAGVTGQLIRITTALAVAAVAAVAAVISYRHAYELVTTHGETGLTARLLPFTVTGSSWPPACSSSTPAAGGLGHGPIGALVSAWPALALAGSFELLMTLIRTGPHAAQTTAPADHEGQVLPIFKLGDVPGAAHCPAGGVRLPGDRRPARRRY